MSKRIFEYEIDLNEMRGYAILFHLIHNLISYDMFIFCVELLGKANLKNGDILFKFNANRPISQELAPLNWHEWFRAMDDTLQIEELLLFSLSGKNPSSNISYEIAIEQSDIFIECIDIRNWRFGTTNAQIEAELNAFFSSNNATKVV